MYDCPMYRALGLNDYKCLKSGQDLTKMNLKASGSQETKRQGITTECQTDSFDIWWRSCETKGHYLTIPDWYLFGMKSTWTWKIELAAHEAPTVSWESYRKTKIQNLATEKEHRISRNSATKAERWAFSNPTAGF